MAQSSHQYRANVGQVLAWFVAYLLTCAIEIPIVVGWLGYLGWADDRRRTLRAVAIAWLLQLTHPLAWWLGPFSWPQLIAAEIVLTLVEGLVLAALTRLERRLGLLISVVANGTSWAVGILASSWLLR